MCTHPFCLYQFTQSHPPSPPLPSLTLTKPLGASVSMKTWLQESSTSRSEMNLKGVALTSCRLTHTNTNEWKTQHTHVIFSFFSHQSIKRDTFILQSKSWQRLEIPVSIMLFLTRSHRGLWAAGRQAAAKRWRLQEAPLWPRSRSPCAAWKWLQIYFPCVNMPTSELIYSFFLRILHC